MCSSRAEHSALRACGVEGWGGGLAANAALGGSARMPALHRAADIAAYLTRPGYMATVLAPQDGAWWDTLRRLGELVPLPGHMAMGCIRRAASSMHGGAAAPHKRSGCVMRQENAVWVPGAWLAGCMRRLQQQGGGGGGWQREGHHRQHRTPARAARAQVQRGELWSGRRMPQPDMQGRRMRSS